MKLDYGTQISPHPITLSIGNIKKPTLNDISRIGFDEFTIFESFTKMTPKIFYTKLNKENGGVELWESLSENERFKMSMYDLIVKNKSLQDVYATLLDFFFIERVAFYDGYFILYKHDSVLDFSLSDNAQYVCGAINDKTFNEILLIIQQICGIYDDSYNVDDKKFASEFAKRKYLEFLEAKKEAQEKSENKSDKNMNIPNIISAVANKHPSINYTNIWNITLFQLLDAFHRLQTNVIFDVDSTRVSVWGDEKKTFDISLWYKNEYDKS